MPSPSVKKPTGGNGGAGGNVYLVADKSLTHLSLQRAHFNAANGLHGGGDGLTGRRGEDCYIKVPCGTVVTEKLTNSELLNGMGVYGEDVDEDETTNLFGKKPEAYDIDPPSVDLDDHGKCILVARGGKPGLGNKALAGGRGKHFRSIVISTFLSHSHFQ